MQPLKITIPGKFWDSQIYSGRLYLFGINQNIITIDWTNLIQSLKIEDDIKLALFCAFLNSDYLYASNFKPLVYDVELKKIIISKFDRLAKKKLEINKEFLRKVIVGEQDNKCPFPHTDTDIYYNNLYVASNNGLFRATCNKKTKYPISTRPEKKWDCPVYNIAASYRCLALSTGDEGLYQLKLENDNYYDESFDDTKLTKLSATNSISCDWNFYSIYSSSYTNKCFLSEFEKNKNEDYRNRYSRKFKELSYDEKIFGDSGYSWGAHDKLYQAKDNNIKIVKYSPWDEDSIFKYINNITLESWKGNIISAKGALFGVIIECENAMVILTSKGENITIPGEPVNWRIFPRSKNYENQLHIIYDDRIEILSFNHDYFVNQKSKYFGSEKFQKNLYSDWDNELFNGEFPTGV